MQTRPLLHLLICFSNSSPKQRLLEYFSIISMPNIAQCYIFLEDLQDNDQLYISNIFKGFPVYIKIVVKLTTVSSRTKLVYSKNLKVLLKSLTFRLGFLKFWMMTAIAFEYRERKF